MIIALTSGDSTAQKRASDEFLNLDEEALGPLKEASRLLKDPAGKRCRFVHDKLAETLDVGKR